MLTLNFYTYLFACWLQTLDHTWNSTIVDCLLHDNSLGVKDIPAPYPQYLSFLDPIFKNLDPLMSSPSL